MNLRPAISVPLPWLTMLIGRLYPGKKERGKRQGLIKFPRSLRVTREGKLFLGVLFIIGIAAINTGNNLLYLIVATLLSLIIISGVMSESTLRGIRAQRVIPRHIFKNSPAPMILEVSNAKAFLPSYSFRVKETDTPGVEAAHSYILKLPPGESDSTTSRYTFTRRGRHRLTGLKVTTSFPFSLFVKGKVEETADEVVVYPSVSTVTRAKLRGVSHLLEGTGSSRKGSGTELYNLRKYTFSDDSRFIHWRSAARMRRLLVKEYEEEAETRVMVRFTNTCAEGHETLFEELVDEAAGTIECYIKDGYSVGLATIGEEIAPAPGPAQLERLLYTLALIEPAGAGSPPSLEVTCQ